MSPISAQKFITYAIGAKRALRFRKARSIVTGNEGVISDGFIDWQNGMVYYELQLTTEAGIETKLHLEQLEFLDGWVMPVFELEAPKKEIATSEPH